MSSSNYTTKVCTKCKHEFPATAEYFRRNGSHLYSHCKACDREQDKHYREENPEYGKRWRKENPEYNKRYREENAEKERERHKRYREENPEYYKLWREENREKVLANERNRRARLANAPGTHTAEDVRLQVTAQTDKRGRLRCWWCGKVIKGNDYHVDHRIPLVRGGSNAPNNLCVSCPVCNMSKHDKLPGEWNGRLL